MHVYIAEIIINQYGKAIAENKSFFRPISSLHNASQRLVISAVKIYMAYIIKYPILCKEDFEQLMTCLLFLDSFIPDKIYKRYIKIDELKKRNKKVKTSDEEFYNELMKNHFENKKESFSKYHDEVVDYINKLNLLDCNSSDYCRKAYELANIEYKPEYESDFQ